MQKLKQPKPQPQPKSKAQKALKPQPKALPATKAPKFKALGPLQRAKAKADLLPRRPKDIAKEASSHRPDWPAPAPYRYLKLDKSNDTGFTRKGPEDLLRRAASAPSSAAAAAQVPQLRARDPGDAAREPETVDLTLEEPARGPPRLLILAAAAAGSTTRPAPGPAALSLARNLF
eukprot:tig00021586_g22666.t1